MTNHRPLRWGGRLALLTLLGAASASAQGLDIRLRQGFSNNVYETGTSAVSEPVGAHFTRLSLAYESPASNRGMSVIVRPEAQFQWYPQSSSGNEMASSLLLRLRNVWRKAESKRKIALDVDVSGEYERALFIKRDVREELRIGALNEDLSFANLPGRLEGQTGLSVRARTSRSMTFELGAFARIRDYLAVSDPSLPDYERLDAREVGGLLGTSTRVSKGIVLSGSAMLRHRIYPNRNAATALGVTDPTLNRQFWYWDLLGTVELAGGDVENTTHVSFRRRADRFEGYYSYSHWEIGNRVTLDVGSNLELRASYSYGRRAYDIFAPAGPPTLSHYHDAGADVRVRVTRSLRLVLGPRYERTVSNDPLFDYVRLDAFAELRIAL